MYTLRTANDAPGLLNSTRGTVYKRIQIPAATAAVEISQVQRTFSFLYNDNLVDHTTQKDTMPQYELEFQ